MSDKEIISPKVIEEFVLQSQKIQNSNEWVSFIVSYTKILKVVDLIPFDPRFNAIQWALDAGKLCKEIVYGLCWMKAYANTYKNETPEGSSPSHAEPHVSYFADNCVTRIDSCRDKVGLIVWAYYSCFDPEKTVLNFEDVMERLKAQVKFGLNLKNADPFIKCLDLLDVDQFKQIKKYRDFKIHRLEPRIELYGVKRHHGWGYMFPLLDSKDIKRWENSLRKQYPKTDARELKFMEDNCRRNGILFERRNVKYLFWDYNKIEKVLDESLSSLLKATDKCFRILLLRKPLKRKRR